MSICMRCGGKCTCGRHGKTPEKLFYACCDGIKYPANHKGQRMEQIRQILDEYLVDVQKENTKMRAALKKIVEWELPATGEFLDEEKTTPASYGFLYGSNGERDHFRQLASSSLAS